jgi:uncharacterized protein
MPERVSMVDYLVVDDGDPYLRANRCNECGAMYFDRRNACAKCGKNDFAIAKLAGEGKLRSFTIVHRAAPGVPTPYVSALVALEGGGLVKANLVGTEPDPQNIRLGMPVRMTTFDAGQDGEGNTAVAFAFTPA